MTLTSTEQALQDRVSELVDDFRQFAENDLRSMIRCCARLQPEVFRLLNSIDELLDLGNKRKCWQESIEMKINTELIHLKIRSNRKELARKLIIDLSLTEPSLYSKANELFQQLKGEK